MGIKSSAILLFVLVSITFLSCKNDDMNDPEPTAALSSPYFPLIDSTTWIHEVKRYRADGSLDWTRIDSSIYINDSLALFGFLGGQVRFKIPLHVEDNKLYSYDSLLWIDYDLINCSSDSTLIFDKNEFPEQQIYQYCKPLEINPSLNYASVNSIKLSSTIWNGAKKQMSGQYYYGYEKGIIHSYLAYYDGRDSVQYTEAQELIRTSLD